LPDLDSTNSTIGKIFFPVSSWIEDRFPHRSVTHSLLATVTLAVLSLSIGYYFLGNIPMAIALPLGHLLACFSDTFTLQGVQLFYPDPAWAVSVSNPRRRLKTGGAGELWVIRDRLSELHFCQEGAGKGDKSSLGTGFRRYLTTPKS
jgi:inner membrane protein